jgi:hypothetical protein
MPCCAARQDKLRYNTKSVIIELAGYGYMNIHTNEVQSLQMTNNILPAVSKVQSLQKYV